MANIKTVNRIIYFHELKVAGIEFYSWYCAYGGKKFTPSILNDKQGKQTFKFNAGQHQIVVKVVDNDGLESIEIIKLNINDILETL